MELIRGNNNLLTKIFSLFQILFVCCFQICVFLVSRVYTELLENPEGAEYLINSYNSTTDSETMYTTDEIQPSTISTDTFDTTEDVVVTTDLTSDETVSSSQTENNDAQNVGGDENSAPGTFPVNPSGALGSSSTGSDNSYGNMIDPNLDVQSRLNLQVHIFVERMLESNEIGAPYIFWKNLFSEIETTPLTDVTWDDIFETLRETIREIQKDSTPDTWNSITIKLSRIVSKRTWWPIVSILNKYSVYLPPANRPMFKIARELREIIGSIAEERPVCHRYGVIPDPQSCSQFYVCFYTFGRWQALKLECRGGQEFNVSIKKCVPPQLSSCNSQNSEETPEFNVPFRFDRYAKGRLL